jgi:Alkylmercury lyase
MTTDPSTPSAALDALAGQLRPGAGVRQRQAVLPEPLRGFHQRLLQAFVTGSGPPDAAAVGRLAAELGLEPQAALAALAGIDLVHTDPSTGTVSVAYPFSGRPTPYRVELAGGPGVFAMCAIDALGIPQMLGRDAHISSVDPVGGQPISVEVHHGTWRFVPASTVVLEGRVAPGAAGGAVADCCCPHINFHVDRAAADAYRQAHPGMTARLLDQAEAVTAAGRAFGSLLDQSNPQEQAP